MRYFFDTEFWDQGNKIDLISIGLVGEDGVTYYAENWDFDWNAVPADHWLQANVRAHLEGGTAARSMDAMADDLRDFCGDSPTFWAYYGAYDWVALCSIYGSMLDVPKGWPHRVRDIAELSEFTNVNPFRVLPQFTKKHHALNDAVWNKACFEWIMAHMNH